MSYDYETTTEYSDADVTEVAQAIEEADEVYQQVAFMAVPKVPCHECGGSGSTPNGSLGDGCLTCMGQRWLPAPHANQVLKQLNLPDLVAMRAQIRAADSALRAGAALPPIPTKEAISKVHDDLGKTSMQLGSGEPMPALAAAPGPKRIAPSDVELDDLEDGREPDLSAHGSIGSGGIGRHTDAQLDDIEDAAEG